ncbi:MAG: N-formylglutamate deformylase [alternative form] [uncultured Nocardioidaceae bacterium]|uniref:N-formylglutamate deformylase [alternative form] n=1 Tax=uncultured Nocardioidaceae bacterium TaxID=253824 RepID=A0A6J4MRS4_9ACTN|nr:MAG: N-formylglutamate deformylase [alternative form] [uncultured Nocardioidaceae bacterium]
MFEQMWSDVVQIGRTGQGGYRRLPWTPAEEELHAWFLEQCGRRGLRVEEDGFGNAVGWWDVDPVGAVDGVVTGSHLDSVVDGGAYDGPLGVVSGLLAVDALRDAGFSPARPIGVSVFRAEEGSRFPVACLGSRLATGALPWDRARTLRDRDGVALADLVAGPGAGLAAGPDGRAGGSLLAGVGCFVELHVEQGRCLVDKDAAVGVASGIWPHGRYRFSFTGEANHAGSTRMEDRRDPMLSYAMTVLAANKQARLSGHRATFGRVAVEPNGTNAVPSHVTGWLDARASTAEELLALVAEVERLAVGRAARDGTDVVVTPESVTTEVQFDAGLAADVAGLGGQGGWPVIPTAAGHDAGVLSAAGIPTAMLFVRNPTGISHSPLERAEDADCVLGVRALADALRLVAGSSDRARAMTRARSDAADAADAADERP